MEFKYKPTQEFAMKLEIHDVGQCAIEIISNMVFEHVHMYSYLIIKTVFGTTTVLECGPIFPGLNIIPNGFICKITEDDYSLDRIRTTIQTFLSDKKNKVVESARELDIIEALNLCLNPIEYMRQQINVEGDK